jgi:hypothetical protein
VTSAVHTPELHDQCSALEPPFDLALGQALGKQLAPGYHAVRRTRQARDHFVHVPVLTTHMVV